MYFNMDLLIFKFFYPVLNLFYLYTEVTAFEVWHIWRLGSIQFKGRLKAV